MNKMEMLALRRKALSARIARQRLDLSMEAAALMPAFKAADKGISFLRFLKAHPVIPAAAAAAFFILRPRRAFGLGKRMWFFWRIYRNARNRLAA